ncbi:HAMP domain-containing methyl-accepting chemotaxis protein [Roseibium polysiphoniae]|uniref:methyl-accepting chemotaxis protein n=1 Tax=Roseibium polysiphoniae TaxID=2571221 RepID=UPI00329749D8
MSVLTAIGVLLIGGIFWWSQNQIAAAFQGLEQSAELSRKVADLSDHAATMQVIEKGYLAAPDAHAHAGFNRELATAQSIVEEISSLSVAAELKPQIADVLDTFEGTAGAFEMLDSVQKKIGYSFNDGLLGVLTQTAGDAQLRLKEEMKFGGGPDFEKLLRAVFAVQLAEKEFILNQTEAYLENFTVAFTTFEGLLKKAYMPNEIKADMGEKMSAYKVAFDAYTVAIAERAKSADLLASLFSLVPPHVEALNAAAQAAQVSAEKELSEIRALSGTVVGAVILAMLIGLSVLAIVIGRSVSVPLASLQKAMVRLASGSSDVELPDVGGRNEISEMSKTVAVFRENAIERVRLAEQQQQENMDRDGRVARLESLIGDFETSLGAALKKLDGSTDELMQTSSAVEAAADDVAGQASQASSAVRVAAENVNSAATASEALASSINEISGQANRSTDVAKQAVESAKGTYRTMDELSKAAMRIGEVMGLIREIADQTNLLALNATIEAARAGEAGKGFAVVAAEVKQLADQTSKATGDIGVQVEAIQGSSNQAMSAIEDVTRIISDMEGLASSVATAVIQQDEAVQSIARNVSDASHRSDEGAELMENVGAATEHSRATGAEVERVASSLSEQAALIRAEASRFLEGVRAA